MSSSCFFVSDLHGRVDRFEKLFTAIEERRPNAVFIGGDILPFPFASLGETQDPPPDDFIRDYLAVRLDAVRSVLAKDYPRVFVIPGNDDPRIEEEALVECGHGGRWRYLHGASDTLGVYAVYGYACVPPTPFRLKDWERYDVSRYVPPGAVSPESGRHSVPIDEHYVRYGTIAGDLEELTGSAPLDNAIMLLHTPPHETLLDRADLDGKFVDSVPLDVHVGSIAVRRFIEKRQPLLTLHGHIHESTRLMGDWRDMLGQTTMFNAAHDGPELCLVTFDPANIGNATRELI